MEGAFIREGALIRINTLDEVWKAGSFLETLPVYTWDDSNKN